MKTRELQRMAKELNKVVAPSPPINLNADRDTLNNEVEEVTGMLAKGDKIPQWLMDKIKDAEFNLPKGVGVVGVEGATGGEKKSKKVDKKETDHSTSNKAQVYLAWNDGKGETDTAKLFKLIKEAVKESTIKSWINQWKNGKNLPAVANK